MSHSPSNGHVRSRQAIGGSYCTLPHLSRQQRAVLAANMLDSSKPSFRPSALQLAAQLSLPPSYVYGACQMTPATRATVLARSPSLSSQES
jgi:hypothetical protein